MTQLKSLLTLAGVLTFSAVAYAGETYEVIASAYYGKRDSSLFAFASRDEIINRRQTRAWNQIKKVCEKKGGDLISAYREYDVAGNEGTVVHGVCRILTQ